MKKIILKILFCLLIFVFFLGCSKVPAGYVGIKVYTLGGGKGEFEELGVGWHMIGMNEELHNFPTFNQNYVWTQDKQESSPNDESFNFSIQGGLVIGVDIGIQYSLEPGKIKEIFQKYRKGVVELTDVTIRNEVRNALNVEGAKYDIDTFVSEGKTEVVKNVEKMVKEKLEPQGIIIQSLYLVTAPRYPQQVVDAINAKIEATQKAIQRQNEVAQEKAQADKEIEKARGEAESILIVAKAQAEANIILSRSLTPQLIEIKKIEKWNGQYPNVLSSNNADMLINANNK